MTKIQYVYILLIMVIEKIDINELSKHDVAEGSECMAYNLKKATRAVQSLFDNAFKTVGLEGTQYTVLSHIYVAEPTTLTKLADMMSVDRTTLGRNLKPLEKKGLIDIKTGDDRRARSITLTKYGLEILAQAQPIWKETHEKIKSLLGVENWSSAIANLKILTSKIKEE